MQPRMSKQQYRGYQALNVLLFVVTGAALLSWQLQPDAPIDTTTLAGIGPSANGAHHQPIPLNLAQPTDLLQVKGLGPKTVEHIDYCRKCLGGFTDKRQLLRVPGIGERTLSKLDSHLIITDLGRHIWQTSPALVPWQPAQTANLNTAARNDLYRICALQKDGVRRILSKRKSLGGFRHWQEVAGLKGVGWAEVKQLQRHFHITPPGLIALNTSGLEDWATLPRVGETIAKRILSYRDSLGGFYAIEQLDAVRGIGLKTLSGFRGRLQATAPEHTLRQMNPMTATAAELANHPYITDQQAAGMIALRETGPIDSAILIENNIFTPAELRRVQVYFMNVK